MSVQRSDIGSLQQRLAAVMGQPMRRPAATPPPVMATPALQAYMLDYYRSQPAQTAFDAVIKGQDRISCDAAFVALCERVEQTLRIKSPNASISEDQQKYESQLMAYLTVIAWSPNHLGPLSYRQAAQQRLLYYAGFGDLDRLHDWRQVREAITGVVYFLSTDDSRLDDFLTLLTNRIRNEAIDSVTGYPRPRWFQPIKALASLLKEHPKINAAEAADFLTGLILPPRQDQEMRAHMLYAISCAMTTTHDGRFDNRSVVWHSLERSYRAYLAGRGGRLSKLSRTPQNQGELLVTLNHDFPPEFDEKGMPFQPPQRKQTRIGISRFDGKPAMIYG